MRIGLFVGMAAAVATTVAGLRPSMADGAHMAMTRCVDLALAAEHALPDIDHPDFHMDSARQRSVFDHYSECARDWFRRQREAHGAPSDGS
jgi:hypothetical protein